MVQRFTVRQATPADAAAVSSVLRASYSQLLRASYDQQTLDRALPFVVEANPKLMSSGTYYVCVSDSGDILGCGGWTRDRPEGGESINGLGHVRHFATHPNHCRIGVARAIYSRCEHDAKNQGITAFECQSSRYAEPFYRSVGFQSVGPVQINFGEGVQFPALRMAKQFTTSQ
jgi:N-acetylglutamate synthase-like GNAT family acetyltransferase